jgi:aminopeptidase N
MKNAQSRTTFLKDYRPPAFTIKTTDLHFDLYEDHALVTSKLLIHLISALDENFTDTLVLQGQHLVLEMLSINGVQLNSDQYVLDDDSLTIPKIQKLIEGGVKDFVLGCQTRIEPHNNTALEGLYKSKKMFCTQCEAEGFRRITYYLDRPDVMSKFTTTIEAEACRYPVLLSNGNKIGSGTSIKDSSRHWCTWEDPFKKPSYLFALVAGDLVSLDDSFITCSDREVELKIFVEKKDLDKCDHAMLSLKNSMRWDEEVYGREYDLDIFMIVAVDDFNMGAMENKGLNIFNTSCVLANPKTQTDLSFQRVEAVVAHEYFHNWSGNRVTCRDWFQLSLKEGFTVFRDSEFSADMNSRTAKRIEDVAFLQTVQFAEDGGPMAHSVRPDSYMEISNFYTVTIYEKGAEVVRMISLLLGNEGFRKGTDLYFERHDGQAVTTEDFIRAMEDASGIDLQRFRNWYSQAGTPLVQIVGNYDSAAKQYSLRVTQSCPNTPGQSKKKPFHIPLRVGLLDEDGKELPLKLSGIENVASSPSIATDLVLDLIEKEQVFVFEDIPAQPIPSLLRGFSAPVKLSCDYSRDDLLFLMVHDTDGFNRWNASQSLLIEIISELQLIYINEGELKLPPILLRAFRGIINNSLENDDSDKVMIAQLLSLPSESLLIEQSDVADVGAIHRVREFLASNLSLQLEPVFEEVLLANTNDDDYSPDASSMASRALKNLALSYLVRTGYERWVDVCYEQFNQANNMTDQLAALRFLVNAKSSKGIIVGEKALAKFYTQWSHEALVIDQWFAVQATSQRDDSLVKVRKLLEHDDFEIRNPNKVRSLIGSFCSQNHQYFHHESGEGYKFLADQILVLDKINPQIAARLLTPLTRWKKFDSARQAQMQLQLQRIKIHPALSKDVFEVVEKSTI